MAHNRPYLVALEIGTSRAANRPRLAVASMVERRNVKSTGVLFTTDTDCHLVGVGGHVRLVEVRAKRVRLVSGTR